MKNDLTCKEAALFGHCVSPVAHMVDVGFVIFTMISQLVKERCELKCDTRKQGLSLFAVLFLAIRGYWMLHTWAEKNIERA